MSTAKNRMVLETHRDFISNTQFRFDLYAAQPEISAPVPNPSPYLDKTFFRLIGPSELLPLKGLHDGALFNFEPFAAGVRGAHALLSKRPANSIEIADAAGLPRESSPKFVQDLVLAGHVRPCWPDRAGKPCVKLQDALIQRALQEHQDYVVFACPKTGTVEYVELGSALALTKFGCGKGSSNSGNQVLALLQKYGYSLGRRLPDGRREEFSDADARAHFDGLCAAADDPKNSTVAYMRALGAI